ncbi:MAG: aminoglycoside phosphotransferase family protein [Polyangiaceae bacterium]|nr:aminoglycoside phosphotransferase family protein [Polyangiaceae bacterium]
MNAAETAPTEARAVEAAVTVGRKLGLRIEEPVVLASAYSVRVHLKPAPVVARVPTWTALIRDSIHEFLTREVSVTRYLAARGVPVVRPTVEIDPGPHECDGLTISFWQYVDVVQKQAPSPQSFGSMLFDLHRELRGYQGALPLLAPPANDIPAAIDRLRLTGTASKEDVEMLVRAHERLMPAIAEPGGPLQPLHGDAHIGNLIATSQGFVWNDFEDVCLGPVAWDMASLTLGEEAIEAYPQRPDRARIALYQEVRRLQVVTWLWALPYEFEGRMGFVDNLLAHFRAADTLEAPHEPTSRR